MDRGIPTRSGRTLHMVGTSYSKGKSYKASTIINGLSLMVLKHSDPDKVVIKLKQPPKVIKELYSNWVEMKGALLLPKSDVDMIFSKLDSLGDKLPRTSETLRNVIERIPWIECAWE